MGNIIEPESIISVGKYEILFASVSYYDEINKMIDSKKVMQYLNNAIVKYNEIDLEYTIDWEEKGKSICMINFKMPADKIHLADIFVTTPYGLIKKNRTGIGATTLELNWRSLKVPWNPILTKDSTYPIQEEWNISNAM